ncbi:MAG: DUF1835 domain-containing protein [Kangiellaceae bacterium]
MTNSIYHILNGSSLRAQFPKQLEGELIVANECLVDGDVQGDSLDELYDIRAKFLSESYGGTIQNYFDKVVNEFNKIHELTIDAEVNLWFEEDLFCQVNFWFVLHLIKLQTDIRKVNLVLPNKENRYGFGGMDNKSLIESFNKKLTITNSDFESLSQFWCFYQSENTDKLLKESELLIEQYPFLLTAVHAHIDRNLSNSKLGRPEQSLLNIMKDLETNEFPKVFREFCQREAVYGFGDLQVKRLFDSLLSRKMN